MSSMHTELFYHFLDLAEVNLSLSFGSVFLISHQNHVPYDTIRMAHIANNSKPP